MRVETTPGRMLLSQIFPRHPAISFDLINRVLTKREVGNLLEAVYRHCGQKETVILADRLLLTLIDYPEVLAQSPLPAGIEDLDDPQLDLLVEIAALVNTQPDISQPELLGTLLAHQQGELVAEAMRRAEAVPRDPASLPRRAVLITPIFASSPSCTNVSPRPRRASAPPITEPGTLPLRPCLYWRRTPYITIMRGFIQHPFVGFQSAIRAVFTQSSQA